MASQQPCKQAKVARSTRESSGVWGEAPRFFFPLSFIIFFEKNDLILNKIHLRNHNKKDKKLCLIVIEHKEMISEWSIQIQLALTHIVILIRCHHLLREQISFVPYPQPGAVPRRACVFQSAPPPQALEGSLPEG